MIFPKTSFGPYNTIKNEVAGYKQISKTTHNKDFDNKLSKPLKKAKHITNTYIHTKSNIFNQHT